MCGIAGGIGPARKQSARELSAVVAALRHRGPDATGFRSVGDCALGHTRLRIIDLSPLGDQPMANEDESVWAVFNGEIYNFGELRRQLEAAGHRFRSNTDTEVLVHLYEEHGPAMVSRLRGMFAFAVWDDRRRRLLLCRDRLGIKPLYFRVDGDRLSFASEVQALARDGDVVDPLAVAGYLRLGWVPGPGTITADVHELLPAHQLVWEDGRAETTRYWSLPTATPAAEAPSTEELSHALHKAMGSHLVADVPVGLFLSSGVDSVALARLSADVAPGLRTYTVGFGTDDDESQEAAAIARRLGLEHTVVEVGGAEAMASVDAFVRSMDQPTVDGLNTWIISRAVRDAGAVVALSGLGGDELFGGYSTFWHVPRLHRAGMRVGTLAAVPSAAAHVLGWSSRTVAWRGRRAVEAVGRGGWADAYSAVRGLFSVAELVRLWPPARDLVDTPFVHTGDGPGLGGAARVGRLEMGNYLPFQLLRDTDCMSMAHALEVRVPLLDDAVVELAARGQACGQPWTKSRLLGAVDPKLAALVDRPKRTFTLPIDDWMRGSLRGTAEDALVGLGEAGLGFDRRALTEVWHGYLGGRVNWRPVWALTMLGRWLEESSGRRLASAAVPAR